MWFELSFSEITVLFSLFFVRKGEKLTIGNGNKKGKAEELKEISEETGGAGSCLRLFCSSQLCLGSLLKRDGDKKLQRKK